MLGKDNFMRVGFSFADPCFVCLTIVKFRFSTHKDYCPIFYIINVSGIMRNCSDVNASNLSHVVNSMRDQFDIDSYFITVLPLH